MGEPPARDGGGCRQPRLRAVLGLIGSGLRTLRSAPPKRETPPLVPTIGPQGSPCDVPRVHAFDDATFVPYGKPEIGWISYASS